MLLFVSFLFALPSNVQLRIQPDEAKAVLAILDKRAEQEPVGDSDWKTLFATEGYVRLQEREHSMKRKFEDDDFEKFVMSDDLLARRAELHRVINDWDKADLDSAAARALAYLPHGAKIAATIYPVIKPLSNSFVFEGNAIFKYVEDESREAFETTIAHELHHIGYNSACPPRNVAEQMDKLPPNLKALSDWLTAFGEGYATLAAGGDRDPERYAKPNVRAAWKEGLANYDKNFRDVEKFYLDVLDRKLTGDAIPNRGFEFFGLLGPWYSVGWKMCIVIEKTLGRGVLIAAFCDPRTLPGTYNRAVAIWQVRTGEALPKWDARLVDAFRDSSTAARPADGGPPATSPSS